LGGDELVALALGAEAVRLFPSDLKGYCLLKLHDPSFHATEQLTLGGVEPIAAPGWSLARVLQALELELRAIELIDDTCEAQAGSDAKAA
jgi:2-keto-3-deoxy-6-phosphogluconate aldolase